MKVFLVARNASSIPKFTIRVKFQHNRQWIFVKWVYIYLMWNMMMAAREINVTICENILMDRLTEKQQEKKEKANKGEIRWIPQQLSEVSWHSKSIAIMIYTLFAWCFFWLTFFWPDTNNRCFITWGASSIISLLLLFTTLGSLSIYLFLGYWHPR